MDDPSIEILSDDSRQWQIDSWSYLEPCQTTDTQVNASSFAEVSK